METQLFFSLIRIGSPIDVFILAINMDVSRDRRATIFVKLCLGIAKKRHGKQKALSYARDDLILQL